VTRAEAEVAAEILRIARDELAIGAAPAPDEPLAERLDSLQLLSLVVAVEDRFRVILGEEDAAATRSLADLARLVVSRADPAALAAPPPAPPAPGDRP